MAKLKEERHFTAPFTVFILTLPYGISVGFASVTLPFLLVQNGFTVAAVASITALGLSSNLWRFAWAPMTDLTLTLHKWYWIGIIFCAVSLLALCFIPLDVKLTALLTIVVFISQVANTFVIAPVGGFMAKTVKTGQKGMASGWFQAGNCGGIGIGGGAGIWLSTHFSYHLSIIVMSVLMMMCAIGLYFVPQVHPEKAENIKAKLKSIVVDIKELFRSRLAIYTTILIVTPIGAGAATYVWSSVGADWRVTPDTVALVTGALSGVIGVVGCIAGGWVADKVGRWWAYFGSGVFMALVTLVMCVSAFTPFTYTTGVLFYAFTYGFANAAFTAVVLHAIGKGLASTKYALLSSIANLGPVYMTALDGYLHDKYSIKFMLMGETVLGIVFTLILLIVLSRLGLHKTEAQPDDMEDMPEVILTNPA